MGHEGERRPELDLELLRAFAETFINRWDTFPIQNPKDGSYYRARDFTTDTPLPLTLPVIERHILGKGMTIGAYMLDSDNRAKSLVFDADDEETWTSIQNMADQLERESVPAYREQSRRGGHLWLFFDPISGKDIRRFGNYLRREFGLDGVELYPKQDKLTPMNGVGSLVRLPLGFHRHPELPNPQRFAFLTPDDNPLAPTVREQMALLAHPQKVPRQFIRKILAVAPESKLAFSPPSFTSKKQRRKFEALAPDKKIKTAISPRDFISQFVELTPTGRGYCPFHDDHRMSFSVYENNWICFAGCEGHTIIDFYIKWKGYPSLRLPEAEWMTVLKDMMNLLGL